MQSNSEIIENCGELAREVYDNNNFIVGKNIFVEDKAYTVVATQADIPEIVANDSGFQGMLLEETDAQGNGTGNYVFAFRGTEADSPIANWDQFYKDLLYLEYGVGPSQYIGITRNIMK